MRFTVPGFRQRQSHPPARMCGVNPSELRQRAVELEGEVRRDDLGPEDDEGAAALLAALAEWNPVVLRRAMIGETGDGNRGESLLRRAVEIAEDEAGD